VGKAVNTSIFQWLATLAGHRENLLLGFPGARHFFMQQSFL
jgi:hypothetical protein